jgi:2-oxoglutarate ferredoxin oxidoreductase subunit alpha
VSGPQRYGPKEAEITFVSWGSTYGPLREVVDRANAESAGRANLIHFTEIWPFPAEATMDVLGSAQRLVAVEGNATAQLANLIRANTGLAMDDTILKYDGRAFTPEYILAHVKEA